MRRTRVLLVAGFLAFVFLGVSAMLARALTASGAERTAALDVVRAEAAGDVDRVLALTPMCAAQAPCTAGARAIVAGLERPGEVEVLQYRPSVQVTLTRTVGYGRIAWRAGRDGRPVVQCVRVRREGPLTGNRAEVLSISAPIRGDAGCP